MHRFFVDPASLRHGPVILAGGPAHQMRSVLRLVPGDHVTLLDNTGMEYEAEIAAYHGDQVQMAIMGRREATGEPGLHITLYQAVLKGDHFNYVLQKGTEVGIAHFVPMVCERSVVTGLAAIEQKRERWQRIIQEAAEQSRRARLPRLAPAVAFDTAVRSVPAEACQLRLIAWEAERSNGLRASLAGCNLRPGMCIEVFVGPEGGFAEGEVALAGAYGVRPVNLGPRVLRAETAGLVVAAALLYEAGDLAPS